MKNKLVFVALMFALSGCTTTQQTGDNKVEVKVYINAELPNLNLGIEDGHDEKIK